MTPYEEADFFALATSLVLQSVQHTPRARYWHRRESRQDPQ